MKRNHKIYLVTLFVVAEIFFFRFEIRLYDYTTQNLITFFSIAFGCYITSISVMYNARVTQMLYLTIDKDNPTRTLLHTVKNYFYYSSIYSIFSILSIIAYSIYSTKDEKGLLTFTTKSINVDILGEMHTFSINNMLSNLVLSISVVNILLLFLLMKVFLSGLLYQANDFIINNELNKR